VNVSSAIESDLIALRRDIHSVPELGYEVARTADLVARRLAPLGFELRRGVAGHGLVADLPGGAGPGPTLLLRADMDALPIVERTGVAFASKVTGAMHACGHDAHVAGLVGAAVLLAERREGWRGRVRLLFQPAEELGTGARRSVDDGALEGVDRALGIHVLGAAPFGVVATRAGAFLAGADAFELTVVGTAGHGALVGATDPILVAAQVIGALQAIVSRETRPGEHVVVSIASVHGGSAAANVVVERVVLRGTLRWFSERERARLLDRVPSLARAVAGAFGAQVEWRVEASVPPLLNDGPSVDVVRAAVEATGRAEVKDPGLIMVSDDFSELAARVPSAFVTFGSGGPTRAPHHHPEFDLDERVIGLMAEVVARASVAVLSADGEPSP
jgi:amidohydrolase